MISFEGDCPATAPHCLSILISPTCVKHHCFFCPPPISVFFSRSKRNVKRVSASLESSHFTRAKRTWPRRAADRNVSSSWPERGKPAPLSFPALREEIQHVSIARGPGTCLYSGLCSTVVPAAREKLELEMKATAAVWHSLPFSHVQCLHLFIQLCTHPAPCSASPCSPPFAAGSAPSLCLLPSQ